MSMWSIRCSKCGAEIDSQDSYGDSQAMLRGHMENVHPEDD